MREIKFRVWNKKLKRFAPDSCSINLQGDDEGVWFDTFTGNFDVEFWPLADCDLLQYTGLKDKDGLEIFEGDIVKTNYDSGYEILNHVVQWGGTAYPAFELSPELNCECNGFSHIFEVGDMTIEVIGNAHKNPELLEKD